MADFQHSQQAYLGAALLVPQQQQQQQQAQALLMPQQPLVPQDSLQERSLWIGDVDQVFNEAAVQAAFAAYGITNITSIRLMHDHTTHLPSGYGFIEFATAHAATAALQACAGKPIPGMPGRTFRINHASSTAGSCLTDAPDYQAYVSGLAPEVTEALLYQIFHERYPTVRGVKLIIDSATGASRGFAFVRFSSEEERATAIRELNATHICGRPIRVSVAQSRQSTPSVLQKPLTPAATAALYGEDEGMTTLYIGSLNPAVTDEQLRRVFSQYGEVLGAKSVPEKCCGFVQFAQRMSAEAAFVMDKQVLGGSRIRVAWSRSQLVTRQPQVPQQVPQQATLTPQQAMQQYMMYIQYWQMMQAQQAQGVAPQVAAPMPQQPQPQQQPETAPKQQQQPTTPAAQAATPTPTTATAAPPPQRVVIPANPSDDASLPRTVEQLNRDFSSQPHMQLFMTTQLRLPRV